MRIHKKPPFFTKLFHWFTLVELIVVISVLAVLATIAMTQVSNITAWARDSQRMTDMSAMKSSIELYKAKTGKLPIPTNGSWVTYSWGLLWTQGTFGEPTWRQLNSITPKPVDPNNAIEYVYSVANNNREFELGGILEKATGLAPSLFPELLAASQNVTFIEGTYNGVSLKVETGSKTYVVAAPSLIGGYLGATMETSGVTIEGLWSLPKGFSGVVVSTAQTGAFTPIIAWSGSKLPETSTGAEAMIQGLQNAYSGSVATSLSQISSLVSATGSQITALGEGLVENALGGEISGQSSGGSSGEPIPVCTICTATWGNITRINTTGGEGITYEPDGNLYFGFADEVVKMTTDGIKTTYASGNIYPRSIAFDDIGNLYLVNKYANSIIRITPWGTKTTLYSYLTTDPVSMVIGNGGMYVTWWNTIVKISMTGTYQWVLAPASGPNALTFDHSGSTLYVSDNGSFSSVNLTTGVKIPLASSLGAMWWATFDSAGNAYVVRVTSKLITKITPAWVATTYADGSGIFSDPRGLTIDPNGNLYVSDSSWVYKITPK